MKSIGMAALALSACAVVVDPPAKVAPGGLDAEHSAELMDDLALLATGRPGSRQEAAILAREGHSRAAFSAYIRRLLASPETTRLAAQVLQIDSGGPRATTTMAVLKRTEIAGETVYYGHEPCARADAVAVKPWWDLDATVLVCSDSYRPDLFTSKNGATCTGHFAQPFAKQTDCGCGPNLIRCATDKETIQRIHRALVAEHRDTIAYLVAQDRPIDEIYTSQGSFRTGLAELVYQRWRIESQEISSLEELPRWSSWPEGGVWARRHESREGMHAGFSTNNYYWHKSDSLRLKLFSLLQDTWCDFSFSSSVGTSALLDLAFHLKAVNVRRDSDPSLLASQPVCTNCHARMDHATSFYNGFQWSHLATHYDSRRQLDTIGPTYGRDIQDRRDSARRNPSAFMHLAVAQPEFASCVAKRITSHVMGSGQTPRELSRLLEALVRKRASYLTLLETALRSYADRRFASTRLRVDTSAPASGMDPVALVDKHCSTCHDADDPFAPSLVTRYGKSWCESIGAECPDVALRLVVSVASSRMPKGGRMTPDQRIDFVTKLAPYVWRDTEERTASVAYFTDQIRGGVPIHRTEALLNSIRAMAPSVPDAEAAVPDGPAPTVLTLDRFGSSLALALALEAAKVCARQPGPQACMERALRAAELRK